MRSNAFRTLTLLACLAGWAWLVPHPAQAAGSDPCRDYLREGKYAEALALAEQILAKEPNPEAALAQVEALRGMGKLQEAAQAAFARINRRTLLDLLS